MPDLDPLTEAHGVSIRLSVAIGVVSVRRALTNPVYR
jgi:hypothetical protein